MKIYEIKSIDCSIKQNRIKLLKEVMRSLKLEEKPDLNKLEKISNKLGEKYNMKITLLEDIAFIHVRGGYSSISFSSKYEAYLKHILYIKEYKRHEREVENYI